MVAAMSLKSKVCGPGRGLLISKQISIISAAIAHIRKIVRHCVLLKDFGLKSAEKGNEKLTIKLGYELRINAKKPFGVMAGLIIS
jgi:hypothetical protein